MHIHLERVIGLLQQKCRILNNIIPIDMLLTKSDLHLTTLDKIVHDISCTLVNTCPSGSVVILTLSAPIPQNCQTHSNNSLAIYHRIV